MNRSAHQTISLARDSADRLEGSFRDSLGRSCSLSESIRAEEASIWLGLTHDNFDSRDETPKRAIITRTRFQQILPALESFSSSGTLPHNIAFRDAFGVPVVLTSFGSDKITFGVVLPKTNSAFPATPNDYLREMRQQSGRLYDQVESMLTAAALGDLSEVGTDRRMILTPQGARQLTNAIARLFHQMDG